MNVSLRSMKRSASVKRKQINKLTKKLDQLQVNSDLDREIESLKARLAEASKIKLF